MARNKDQWYASLKEWLPNWWFSTPGNQDAVLYGMAAVLERLEGTLDEHIGQTFIGEAEGGYLAEHGAERNLVQGDTESDDNFRERIRNLTNSTNYPSIKALVDALLDVGESTIIEDFDAGIFLSREQFLNRSQIFLDQVKDAFSIIVDRQVHAPYSFYTRENFLDREDFIGTNESDFALFQQIITAVNTAKALGTPYRLIERLE